MPINALLIVLVSAVMHAGWNLLMRGSGGPMRFARRMLWAVTAITIVPVIIFEFTRTPLGWPVWGIGVGSGVCCGLYYFGLGRAYRSTDFTIAYPVARALPVIAIGVIDMFLNEPPKPLGWLGMLLVVIGCVLVPLESWRAFHLHRYLNRASIWIGLTALGTVGYSLLDDRAASRMESLHIQGFEGGLRYSAVFFMFAAVSLELLLRVTRTRPNPGPNPKWSHIAPAAILVYVAYALIVWVYQMVEQVSYVVAFRQFSIVIGVVAAFLLFHEAGRAIRIFASVLLTIGLMVISLWG